MDDLRDWNISGRVPNRFPLPEFERRGPLPLFRERHRAPGSIVTLGVIVAVGSAAGLVASIPSLSARGRADASAVITALSVGIALGLSAATQTFSIVVRDGTLIVWLTPFFRKSVPAALIASVSTTTINPAGYGGVGARRAPGRPPAVFQRGGPAAELVMQDGSVLLIECDNVDGLADALR